jgi:hypothetical protein
MNLECEFFVSGNDGTDIRAMHYSMDAASSRTQTRSSEDKLGAFHFKLKYVGRLKHDTLRATFYKVFNAAGEQWRYVLYACSVLRTVPHSLFRSSAPFHFLPVLLLLVDCRLFILKHILCAPRGPPRNKRGRWPAIYYL